MEFRNLRADEIECRVGMIRDGEKPFFTLLLYKDARCDMNILDETGVIWTRRHYECKGNLFCEVGIFDKSLGQFVYRSDCGVESNTEKEKGEASDSFKRACVNWGIGRELYTSPAIFVNGHVKRVKDKLVPDFKKIEVTDIRYEAKKIIFLEITGYTDKKEEVVIFKWGTTPSHEPVREDKPLTLDEASQFKTTKGKAYAELPNEQLEYIIENAKNERNRRAAQLVLDDRQAAFQDLEIPDEANLPF